MKNMTETAEQLIGALGPEFLAALDAFDAAENAISAFYKKCHNHDEAMMYLRYCASLLAMKSASYAGTAIVDYGASPEVAFETIQNRALSGLAFVLNLHEDTCPKKTECIGGNLLKAFLTEKMAVVKQQTANEAASDTTAH